MTFSTIMRRTADTLINKYGVSAKLISQDGSSRTTRAVITTVTTDDLADTYVTTTDKVVYIRFTSGLVPREGDTIQFSQSRGNYVVFRVQTYSVDDVPGNNIAYRLIVRP